MKIAVDLDATITAYPSFFKVFTKAMRKAGCEIHIVTDRFPGTEKQVAKELESYEISYDEIEITKNKPEYIQNECISVLFDDTDEYFLDLPEVVAVFKVREHYNFDFMEKKWVYSNRTGINLDKQV